MKKFFKIFLLFFCLPITIFIAFVFGSTFYIRCFMHEHFDYQDHTAHFNISYNESEKEAIADIENALEGSYERITTDLKQPMDKPINIKIYPDLNSLHFSLKLNSGLFWWIKIFTKMSPQVVGNTDENNYIKMVSPINPGESGYTYDTIISVAVHEFTHTVAFELNPNQKSIMTGFGMFLQEGIAVYESGQWRQQLFEEKIIRTNDILHALPESIDMLSPTDSHRYVTGYSFVKYIIDNYGYDKIIDLLKKNYSDGNYDSETRSLYSKWVEYLKENQS